MEAEKLGTGMRPACLAICRPQVQVHVRSSIDISADVRYSVCVGSKGMVPAGHLVVCSAIS